MKDLPPEWAHYHACQLDALRRTARGSDRIDPQAWGREAALNRAIVAISAGDHPTAIVETSERALRSEARLERSRAAARERFRIAAPGEGSAAAERSVEAKSDLRLCLRVVSERPRDAGLLDAALDGIPPAGLSPGAYRVGLMRLRSRLSAALAA